MLLEAAPTPIRDNHAAIVVALRGMDRGDARLAEALWINWSNGHYRKLGFRSISEYMREAFKDTEMDQIARMHARGVQRLLKEWKLAAEISVFRENFDRIIRSKRRLIAQVMTPENAAEWVDKALRLSARELEDLIVRKVAEGEVDIDRPTQRRIWMYKSQHERFNEALELASTMLASEGKDPKTVTGERLAMISEEFMSTHASPTVVWGWVQAECPACCKPSRLNRVPSDDFMRPLEDGREARVLVHECARCGAQIMMTGVQLDGTS